MHSPPFPSSLFTFSSTPNPQSCHKNPIFFTSLKNPSSLLICSSTPTNPNPQFYRKNPIFFTSLKNSSCFLAISSTPSSKNPIFFTSLKFSANGCYSNSTTTRLGLSSASCLITEEATLEKLTVIDKVHSLASEFRSLPEPIDKVKRLLHYASILPPLNESAKVQENRVMGCTTQVWLQVRMDNKGSMRFRVDSDSEITKGFCSCLIWLLDGAQPEEILSVTAEDLADMNVGLPNKGRSRVNTWHNVLFSMQNRTLDCVKERETSLSLKNLHSLVVRPHGSYLESEPKCSLKVK